MPNNSIPKFLVSIIPLLLIFFSFGWLFFTFAPAVRAELDYQFRQSLSALGADNLRELFFPHDLALELESSTSYRDFAIVIPKINLDERVVFNVDPNDKKAYGEALKIGIAHASGTGFPGDPRMGYYFAHSSTSVFSRQLNAVFYLLGKLEAGDEVFIWHDGEKFRYQVTGSEVTTPGDVSFLQQKYDEETIVLQTCWPLGTTLKRKLVFAKRI